MINQKKSHHLNALKTLSILPFLAFFLLSFTIEETYTFPQHEQSPNGMDRIEIVIDKNTTDDELLTIKANLAKKQFDFSYTTVRNEEGKIKNISLNVSGGNTKSGEVRSRFTTASDNDTIDPTYILIDTNTNTITIGSDKTVKNSYTVTSPTPQKEDATQHSKMGHQTNVSTANDSAYIFIQEPGETNHKDNLITVTSGTSKTVVISTPQAKEHDVKIAEAEGEASMFVKNEGGEPLFYVDGKKMNADDIKALDPNTIESMNVLKGENAIYLYGKEASNGVIVITTKTDD